MSSSSVDVAGPTRRLPMVFANRAKSGNAVPTSGTEIYASRTSRNAEVPKMVCRLHGIGMERGLGPSGRFVRTCSRRSDSGPMSSAEGMRLHHLPRLARAAIDCLIDRESSDSAVAPRHPGAVAVPDTWASLHRGRCDRGLGRRGGRGRATRRRRAERGVSLAERASADADEYGQPGDLALAPRAVD